MKNMKKLISMLLVAVMVMAMGICSSAAEGDKTLTINTANDHTYYVYQMLVGDVSGLEDGSGTLANVTAGQNLSGSVADFDTAIKDADGKYLTGTALASAASKKIDSTKAVYATLDKDTKSYSCAPGYYVVKDTYTDSGVECAAYMVAVVGDTTMNPKTDTPDIDKNIIDTDKNAALETGDSKKTDTAAVGDVINYEVTGNVPVTEGYKYYYYIVNDTLSKGLTLDATSFEVTITSKDADGNDVVKTLSATGDNKEYAVYVTNNDDGTTSFKLAIMDMKKYPAGAAISIKYNATVNKDAEVGLVPNTNTVKLQYSNNPSDTYDKDKEDKPEEPGTPKEPGDVKGVSPERVTKTYVTEVSIQKIDKTEGKFIDALATAEFTLTGNGLNDVVIKTETTFEEATNGTYYLLANGTYTDTAPTADTEATYANDGKKYAKVTRVTSVSDADSGASVSVVAKVDSTGKITFSGLNAGTYKLEETNVPTGYNKAADVEFTISAKIPEGTTESATTGSAITWSSDNENVQPGATAGVFETTIENQKGNLLPSTGGIGTTIFYVAGTILALGAGVVLVAKRRIAR